MRPKIKQRAKLAAIAVGCIFMLALNAYTKNKEFNYFDRDTFVSYSGIITEADSARIKLILDVFAKELRSYSKLCYSDSFKVTYNYYLFDGDTLRSIAPRYNIDPGFTPGFIGTKTIWEHKQPTFDGFIKWFLNKR